MFAQEFVRNAWLAGTAIALASGLIGYFVVLRAQVFAGDALSHVAFTGALAAAAAGIDIRIGLFAATILIALLLGRSATARTPTTSRSGSRSPRSSGSACTSSPCSAPDPEAATACSEPAPCSDRSSGSAPPTP